MSKSHARPLQHPLHCAMIHFATPHAAGTNAHVMTSIWQTPPFARRDGKPKGTYDVGLAPIGFEHWLTIANEHPRMAEKLSCLADKNAVTYLAARELEADVRLAEQEISKRVNQFSQTPMPAAPSPLVRACHTVFDDLCILDRNAPSPVLISGCVASPSYWRLQDKIGRPMREVHAPAVGLNDNLGARIDEFIRRLPDERLFERRNWFIHTSEALYQGDPDPIEDFISGPLFLRSERQTLRGFGRWVCFSISVSTHPLADIAAFPEALDTLTRAMALLSDDELEHFGGVEKQQAILARLN